KARLLEALSEAAQLVLVQRYGGEEPDHRHRLPLRPRRERPRRRGERNSLNEITSSHCPLTIAPTYGVQLQQEFLTGEMRFWVKLHSSNFESRMSASGQKQKSELIQTMSALPQKANIESQSRNVRFVPIADISLIQSPRRHEQEPPAAKLGRAPL